MAGQERVTEKVCDDTPETRSAGRALVQAALRRAEGDGYRLLKARAVSMVANESGDSGDQETALGLFLPSLRGLYAGDVPATRIYPVLGNLGLIEMGAPRLHGSEVYFAEALDWAELGGLRGPAAQIRMLLARIELQAGEAKDAERQLSAADREGSPGSVGSPEGAHQGIGAELLASTMLQSGDLSGANRYLHQASESLMQTSDIYLTRQDAMNRGQLALALGHPDQAATLLESAIRMSEGSDVRRSDRATGAEFGELDHDAYAELAASWLALGRSGARVLALWERFRLRSRGMPITQCAGGALDCELPRLEREQRRLGSDTLVGQIVLLDRILVYRMDSRGIQWSEKRMARQSLLDAARALERAVSSPHSSAETAAKLGAGLASDLLPELPASLPGKSSLLVEADPNLADFPWPVLPGKGGPLGIAYPVAELRSILAPAAERGDLLAGSERALVVGASVAGADEPPLPEAMSEANHVDRWLHSGEILLGERATAARIGANLGSATIFHFAGHAMQTRDGTELLLAAASSSDQAPWLDGKFLRQHPPLACRLAVLSACSTGTREAAWSHPLQDMVDAFSSMGVREVVATRWQIDSGASVPLIDAFYDGLAKGDTVAMALTSARRAQFGNPGYRNPYYWGAYYLTGREIEDPTGEFHARR